MSENQHALTSSICVENELKRHEELSISRSEPVCTSHIALICVCVVCGVCCVLCVCVSVCVCVCVCVYLCVCVCVSNLLLSSSDTDIV